MIVIMSVTMYVFICIYTHNDIYIYIYIHTHTHTHMIYIITKVVPGAVAEHLEVPLRERAVPE